MSIYFLYFRLNGFVFMQFEQVVTIIVRGLAYTWQRFLCIMDRRWPAQHNYPKVIALYCPLVF